MMTSGIDDFLYIIIGLIVIFGGSIEKYIRAKKQQETVRPAVAPENGQEDDSEAFSPPPDTEEATTSFEEFVPRYEALEIRANEPEYTTPRQNDDIQSRMQEEALHSIGAKTGAYSLNSSDTTGFDLRQAIIAAEILNRKY
ncbi:MAG: hypothetical protein LBR08_05890 [Bacteroidales bacterium]|jgi:hypothetical protein|nr:hypothetical protein [Bacteroidales bacterium]